MTKWASLLHLLSSVSIIFSISYQERVGGTLPLLLHTVILKLLRILFKMLGLSDLPATTPILASVEWRKIRNIHVFYKSPRRLQKPRPYIQTVCVKFQIWLATTCSLVRLIDYQHQKKSCHMNSAVGKTEVAQLHCLLSSRCLRYRCHSLGMSRNICKPNKIYKSML